MKRARLFAAALALSAIQSWSARADQDCDKAKTQLDLNLCARADFDRADAAMNAAYRRTMAELKDDETSGKLLLSAQRAWLTFRDAHCAAEGAAAEGGSMQPMVVSGCLAGLTRERTKQLDGFQEDR